MSDTICRKLLITGRVQGVGYRWSLCAEAEVLGLAGWVRNRHDGSVEALIIGATDLVEALTVWAHRGPPSAQVDAVLCSDQPTVAGEVLNGFAQRPTA